MLAAVCYGDVAIRPLREVTRRTCWSPVHWPPRIAPLWRRFRAVPWTVRRILRRPGFACTLCAASDSSFRPVGVVILLIEW